MGAFLNALYEEGTRQEIFDWLVKIEEENTRLQAVVDAARHDHRGVHDYGTPERPNGAAGRGDWGCETCQALAALDNHGRTK